MSKVKVREDDLERLLEHVRGDAQAEANGAWLKGDGPDARLVSVIHACRRIHKAMTRSLAGRKAFETARANGNLPPVLTRVQGVSLLGGVVVDGDEGKALYVFERR